MQKPSVNFPDSSSKSDIPYQELTELKEIGGGTFGIVYSGVWRQFHVAVKKLRSEILTPEMEEDFMREADLMAKLKAPNIIQFYGISIDQKTFCIVMEYMSFGSLYHVLNNKSIELTWPVREKITLDIACGLSFLHCENIIHRDMKSLNVLLNEHMQAKLTDFGLAKIKQNPETFIQSLPAGTPYWMAPELFKPLAQFSKYSDIYAYGITLWEIAARCIPYSDASSPAVALQWVQEGKRETIPADCPPKLAKLITFCWSATIKERPLAENIVKHLRNDPLMDDISKSNDGNSSDNTAKEKSFSSKESTIKCSVM